MKDAMRKRISVRGTRSSLFTSFVSLLLCISMLLGTTFAWFTDTVTSANNIIASGNLDVALYHADKGTDGADKPVDSNTKLFDDVDSELWEPGAMAWEKFTVANEGSLNLKYEFTLNTRYATVVDGVSFASMLKVAVVDENFVYNRENVQSLKNFTSLETFTLPGDLTPGSSDVFGIVIWWQPSGNDNLFNMNNGRRGQEASIEVGVNLVATQSTGEMDSFDSNYDAGALFPKAKINLSEKKSVANQVSAEGLLTEPVSVGSEQRDLSASVPVGVQLADGTTELNLTVQTVDKSEANVEVDESIDEEVLSIDVHMEGVAEDNTVPMQITIKEFVRPGLNDNSIRLYHVEDGQTIQMIAVPTLADLDEHNEFYYNAVTGDLILSMATFSEVTVVANEHWDGKSATAFHGGSGTEADPYLIANASQLAYFRDIVDGKVAWDGDTTFTGQYVKLSNDIYLNHDIEPGEAHLFDPIGYGYECDAYMTDGKYFSGTFDGNNKFIYGLYQNGWDLEAKATQAGVTGDYTYSMAGGGLFASVVGKSEETPVVIKNLTLKNVKIEMECVDMGILVGYSQGHCVYENIYVYHSTIANYQRATGGVVGEVSPYYSYNAETGVKTPVISKHVFKGINVGTSCTVGTLWGDFDAPVGGVIGAKWDSTGTTRVTMENVNVSCKLDIYNDVTSAYQWYAYRRAGMLIGNTEEYETDENGRTVATASFLTCINKEITSDGVTKTVPSVVVVYDDSWRNYTYCEFSTEKNPGKDYPWVRVEGSAYNNPYSNPRYGHPKDADGNIVTNELHKHAEGEGNAVMLTVDQLYGGGQGVYGNPMHYNSTDNDQVADVTIGKYTVIYMDGTRVLGVDYVPHNDKDWTLKKVEDAAFTEYFQSQEYNLSKLSWEDIDNKTMTSIPAGNVKDIVVYLKIEDTNFVRFVDRDGVVIHEQEFVTRQSDSHYSSNITEPAVPTVTGYVGIWPDYYGWLREASGDVTIHPVYTKVYEDPSVLPDEKEIIIMDTGFNINDFFRLLSQGYSLVMYRDLEGSIGNASKVTFGDITYGDVGEDGVVSKHARFELDSYTLKYDNNSNANKDWTLFKINNGSSLTVGAGPSKSGTLIFEFDTLNGNASPCLFDIQEGGMLVLERGVTIEMRFKDGILSDEELANSLSVMMRGHEHSGNNIDGAETVHPGLHIETIYDKDTGYDVIRLTVTSNTIIQNHHDN